MRELSMFMRSLFLAGALSVPGTLLSSSHVTAQSPARVYLSIDRFQVLELDEPARKVAVANPSIADVQMINPTQVLLNGKAVGVTSLVVFSGRSRQSFDLVVSPAPVGGASLPSTGAGHHTVLVQRGDRLTEQLFARDGDQGWLELRQVRPEADGSKK